LKTLGLGLGFGALGGHCHGGPARLLFVWSLSELSLKQPTVVTGFPFWRRLVQ